MLLNNAKFGIKVSWFFILMSLFWMGVWAFITYIFLFLETPIIKRSNPSIVASQAITLVPWFPGFLIFVVYFLRDFGKEIKISGSEIIIHRWNRNKVINKSEIKNVIKVVCSASHKIPWVDFYYYVVILNSGKRIVFTCFLDNKQNLIGKVKSNTKSSYSEIRAFVPLSFP